MRTLTTAVLCLSMLAVAGCSRKDPQFAQLGGSEPQRLSFGSPKIVKAAFIKKMQACWFSGSYPLLGGYQINSSPALVKVSDGEAEVQQVAVEFAAGYHGSFDDEIMLQLTKQLPKNIFSSWGSYLVRITISFFFVPYITSNTG